MILDGEELRRCPRRPILENPEYFGELFWLYRQHKAGYTSEPGGLSDQPGKLMNCFREIDVAMIKVDKFREEQEERKRRRAARAGATKTRGPTAPRR